MLIVDAQVHIWGADTPDRPWPPGRAADAQKPNRVTKDLARGQREGRRRSRRHRAPSWEGDREDLALDAARLHPDRFAVMGRLVAGLARRAAVPSTSWKAQPGMLGMRFTFHPSRQGHWLTDGTADWLWPAVERAGIPVMLSAAGSLALVDAIAERHPGLRVVVDHMGIRSGLKGDEAFAGIPQLCALARRPNVAVKSSAVPCYATEPYPFRDVHAHLRRVHDAFGPRRMFWGTDWTRLPCPWRQAVTLFTEELPWLPAADQEWVMGRGICEWLGWPLPAAP